MSISNIGGASFIQRKFTSFSSLALSAHCKKKIVCCNKQSAESKTLIAQKIKTMKALILVHLPTLVNFFYRRSNCPTSPVHVCRFMTQATQLVMHLSRDFTFTDNTDLLYKVLILRGFVVCFFHDVHVFFSGQAKSSLFWILKLLSCQGQLGQSYTHYFPLSTLNSNILYLVLKQISGYIVQHLLFNSYSVRLAAFWINNICLRDLSPF